MSGRSIHLSLANDLIGAYAFLGKLVKFINFCHCRPESASSFAELAFQSDSGAQSVSGLG